MLKITEAVQQGIIAHARKDAPIEACGYLGEKNGIITSQYRMKNIDASGEHFSFEPGEQFSVIRSLREVGEKASAVYHSHPESPARPSKEDIRLAYDPTVSYVIVSLGENEPVLRSFKIKSGVVTPEEIEIVAGDC